MNILIISHYAGGHEYGSEQRPFILARAWAAMGDRVVIAAGDYSHKRRSNPKVAEDLEEIGQEGVTYVFIKTPPYENGVGSQNKNIGAFAKKLCRAAGRLAEKYAPDVVVAASGHPFDVRAARKIAKKTGAAFVFELRENWPDIQEERYGRAPEIYYARWVMGRALRAADRVVSILPEGEKYLARYHVAAEKYTFIPEIIPPSAGAPHISPGPREYLLRLQSGYDFILLCQGYVSREKGLQRLVEAAKLLEDQSVAVVIVGNGSYRINLKRQMRELTAANVYLLDRVEEEEKQGLFALADCLFYGDERRSAVRYGVTGSKLLEYMDAGKPIITALRTAQSPVAAAGCGVNVQEPGAAALAKAILEMMALGRNGRARLGEQGRDYLHKHHDPQIAAERFHAVLEEAREIKNKEIKA